MPPFLQLFLDRPLGALAIYLGFSLFSWLFLKRWHVRHAGLKGPIATAAFMPVYSFTYSSTCCAAWMTWGRFLPLAFLAAVLGILWLIGPRDRPYPRRIG